MEARATSHLDWMGSTGTSRLVQIIFWHFELCC